MTNKWMLFFKESDFSYYLFNGQWPVAVRPHTSSFEQQPEDDTMEKQCARVEKYIPLLEEVLEKPRVKVFVVNKSRYIVAQRGTFAELD
jgi:hypothetical protein